MSPPEIEDEVRKHYAIINTPNSLAAARAHRKAVVESSPEVAALRARVAELEAALRALAGGVCRLSRSWSEASTIGDALTEAERVLGGAK